MNPNQHQARLSHFQLGHPIISLQHNRLAHLQVQTSQSWTQLLQVLPRVTTMHTASLASLVTPVGLPVVIMTDLRRGIGLELYAFCLTLFLLPMFLYSR